MNACPVCGGALRPEPLPRYQLDLGGISVALIESVFRERCDGCGENRVVIPDMEGLIAAAAIGRVMLPFKLSGLEVRFLRKAMEMTARKLATQMEVREETVSRWENGKEPIGPSSEKLLRLIVGEELHENAPAVDYDQHSIVNMRLQPVRLSG